MLGLAVKILVALLVVYGLIVLLAWRFQERLAFPGRTATLPAPSARGIPEGELVTAVTADGVRLEGWYLPPRPAPPAGERAPGVIWFYGNMESVGDLAPILREFRPPGVGMLALDYRGYGQNPGTPTEPGLYRDAEAAWALLTDRPEIDSARVAVYGRSLGSAVALYLATERPVRAVILESPFSTAREMAVEHYAIVPNTLLHLRLDNLERAARLRVPLLVFHGTEDRIAPLRMGRAVADTAPLGEIVLIHGAGHNDTYQSGGERYRSAFHAFLREHLANRVHPQ